MSRVSTLEKLYNKPKKNALEFDYDALWAPPIYSLLTQQDINELYKIATSVKLSGNVNKKYQLIDTVMERRGFRFDHRGTNRATYRFLEAPYFLAKVALDRVGIKDSPAEFKNQAYFKPFCCKIFEVDPSGVIAFVERVNPITSLEEFASVADDIFNMMVTKIIGKYVVDDLGTTKYMNYGIRMWNGCAFGPVVIDFPYAFELDGAKLICRNTLRGTNVMCGGEIDYDAGFNNLVCKRCGKVYTARELKKDESIVSKIFTDGTGKEYQVRARVVSEDGKVILDSGRSSKRYVNPEGMRYVGMINCNEDQTPVIKTIELRSNKHESPVQVSRRIHEEQMNYRKRAEKQIREKFNPVINKKPEVTPVIKSTRNAIEELPPMYDQEPRGYTHTEVIGDSDWDYTEEPVTNVDPEINADISYEPDINELIPELNNPPIDEPSDKTECNLEDSHIETTVDSNGDDEDNTTKIPLSDIISPKELIEMAYMPLASELRDRINNSTDSYEQPDYSAYEPEEPESEDNPMDEEDPYEQMYEEEDRRRNKDRRRSKPDMSEY